jgi:hypothetical protein
MDMKHRHAEWTQSIETDRHHEHRQHGHVKGHVTEMQHGLAVETLYSRDIQYKHAAWKCSTDKQQGQSA